MKKILLSLVLIAIGLLALVGPSRAIECNGDLPDEISELKAFADDCQAKISVLQVEQKTLKSAISLLNSKISLTTAQIKATTTQIMQLEQDIQTLSGVIVDLNRELDNLVSIYISRLRRSYMDRETSPVMLFFASESFNTFQNKLKYLSIASRRDQIILHELESARVDLDGQKTSKEEKQVEVENLKASLEDQKKVLGVQTSQKNQLLTETQSSEKKYQQLKAEAERQLAAFRRFVTGQGGASILTGQTVCNDWGCYYNQRDSSWGNQLIGLSSETMKEVGCLVTSMAMIASHYGKSVNPGQIAASSEPFFNKSAYMLQGSWSAAGVTMTRTRLGSSTSWIDQELAAGRPVVVGIYGGPDHFIVIKAKEGQDYIMNDPFVENGNDIKFTDKYPLSAISAVDRVSVK